MRQRRSIATFASWNVVGLVAARSGSRTTSPIAARAKPFPNTETAQPSWLARRRKSRRETPLSSGFDFTRRSVLVAPLLEGFVEAGRILRAGGDVKQRGGREHHGSTPPLGMHPATVRRTCVGARRASSIVFIWW